MRMRIIEVLTKLEGIDSRGARRKKRNAAVIRIYKDLNVVEIRFDAIENYFDINKSTYINDIIAWMRTYISNDITAFDVYDVLDYIKENGKKRRSYTELAKHENEQWIRGHNWNWE